MPSTRVRDLDTIDIARGRTAVVTDCSGDFDALASCDVGADEVEQVDLWIEIVTGPVRRAETGPRCRRRALVDHLTSAKRRHDEELANGQRVGDGNRRRTTAVRRSPEGDISAQRRKPHTINNLPLVAVVGRTPERQRLGTVRADREIGVQLTRRIDLRITKDDEVRLALDLSAGRKAPSVRKGKSAL